MKHYKYSLFSSDSLLRKRGAEVAYEGSSGAILQTLEDLREKVLSAFFFFGRGASFDAVERATSFGGSACITQRKGAF